MAYIKQTSGKSGTFVDGVTSYSGHGQARNVALFEPKPTSASINLYTVHYNESWQTDVSEQ